MDAAKMLDELIEKRLCIEAYVNDPTQQGYSRAVVDELINLAIEYGKLYERIRQKLTPGPMITLPGMR